MGFHRQLLFQASKFERDMGGEEVVVVIAVAVIAKEESREIITILMTPNYTCVERGKRRNF